MSNTAKKLSGKTALVTGGSRGIGAAIARRLAADGANVAISYSASADKAKALVAEIRKGGVKAESFQADQGDRAQVEKLVGDVAKQFGGIDILVNNAGVFVTGPVGNDPAQVKEFDRQQSVNIGGVVTAVRAATAHLKEGGRIISIGSVVNDRIPGPGMADYTATKAAVAAYARGWAKDLAPKRITVNTVQPGPIDTEMNPADSEMAKGFIPMIPLGRYGTAEEVAAAVAFLASDEAGYITGTTITVDGGFSV